MGQTAFQALEKGTYTVVAGDDTAGTVDITLRNTPTVLVVDILRAGVSVKEDAVITAGTEKITVADGGVTYALTAGDVIHYIVG